MGVFHVPLDKENNAQVDDHLNARKIRFSNRTGNYILL